VKTASQAPPITVALIGNPNTGKSTLFNALCGVRQRVGNYPGVTVEKKFGRMSDGPHEYAVIDLPGTYSLAPRSPDEMVAVDVLLGRSDAQPMPDALVCIVDAGNLERNLYLVSQVLELERPTVVALNMMDLARERGVTIDIARLSRQLGVPVVPMEAVRRKGVAELKTALREALDRPPAARASPFPEAFLNEVRSLESCLGQAIDQTSSQSNGQSASGAKPGLPRFLVERLLLDTTGYLEGILRPVAPDVHPQIIAARDRLKAAGCPVPTIEAIARYRWVGDVLEGAVVRPQGKRPTLSDRLDHVLTDRWTGTLIFALLMAGVFCAIFLLAEYPMTLIDTGIGAAGDWLGEWLPEGALRSLLVDGAVGGVGAVVVFLPQILLLFGFIAVMEDCGYMARAAYLMDRLMARVGLSGKSFIPLLSSFACAVPGIMAARVIENRRDRLTTILVAPLMSCSARLPVYTILITAFIPTNTLLGRFLPGLTMFAMYLVGVVAAVLVALVLKKTLLKGATPPFVMELPSYKLPSPGVVLHRMADRGWSFVRRAGTLIFAVSLVVWALGYYPRDAATVEGPYQARRAEIEAELAALAGDGAAAARREARHEELDQIAHQIDAAYLQQSYLGRMGRAIEPAVRPLGWDWRIGCAAIASFPAREVVMGTLGVIYQLGGEIDVGEESDQQRLIGKLRAARWDGTNERVYNVPVALSLMVFFALCAQCASTLAVIRRETAHWGWSVFTFTYMTVLAYLGALGTYQVGRLWL
jgi:ferrous iron transport protein B